MRDLVPDLTAFRTAPAWVPSRVPRRAFLTAVLGSAACWFGIAGLLAMASECDDEEPPRGSPRPGAHMNGGRGAGRRGIEGGTNPNGDPR